MASLAREAVLRVKRSEPKGWWVVVQSQVNTSSVIQLVSTSRSWQLLPLEKPSLRYSPHLLPWENVRKTSGNRRSVQRSTWLKFPRRITGYTPPSCRGKMQVRRGARGFLDGSVQRRTWLRLTRRITGYTPPSCRWKMWGRLAEIEGVYREVHDWDWRDVLLTFYRQHKTPVYSAGALYTYSVVRMQSLFTIRVFSNSISD